MRFIYFHEFIIHSHDFSMSKRQKNTGLFNSDIIFLGQNSEIVMNRDA